MSQLIIGIEDSYNIGAANNILFAARFQAIEDGELTEIRLSSGAAGFAKAGAFDGGWSFLCSNNTGLACSAGQWNSIPVYCPTPIVYGYDYWLIMIADTDAVIRRGSATGVGSANYKTSWSYANGIPSSVPSWDGGFTYRFGVVGYGNVGGGVPAPLFGGGF